MSSTARNYLISQLDDLPGQPCPCGTTRRGFISPENNVASVHQVDIKVDAQTHYHKTMTEIYVILEGTGEMELDGDRIPVRPMSSIMIKPGCRHRAIGQLKILNIAIPKFDPQDEWFD
ncbi:MAG: cupin domain-containing protein [Limisphaerales bacterium]